MWNRLYYPDDRVNIKQRPYMPPAVRQRVADEGAKATLKKESIKHMLEEIKNLEVHAKIDERVENKRYIRLQATEIAEREMQESLAKAQRQQEVKAKEREQDERLARELEQRKLEEARDVALRRQVREESLELRDLEAKLREAYTLKERVAQMAERRALRYDEIKREAEIGQIMEEQQERARRLDEQYSRERYTERQHYKEGLERQLEEQEIRKQQAYEELLKEKLMVDEMVRKIYEEDERQNELKLRKQHATKAYMEEFARAREFFREQERLRMEEENRKIVEFGKVHEEREAELRRQRTERSDLLAEFQRRVGEMLEREAREKEELEDARMVIAQDELERKAEEKDGANITNKLRRRLQLRANYEQAMLLRALRLEAERQENAEADRQILAKYAETERAARVNDELRRQRQLEYRQAAEALLEHRRSLKEQEEQEKAQEQEREESRQAQRRRIIEEERQRMLREHAWRLLGFLPRGVLRDVEDVERLGPDFKAAYLDRAASVLEEVPWEPPQTQNQLHNPERLGIYPDPDLPASQIGRPTLP